MAIFGMLVTGPRSKGCTATSRSTRFITYYMAN